MIDFFNNAAADLPDQTRLKGRKLPSMSAVLDGKGGNFADVFEPGNRRIWVSLADIPDFVQKAFVAAEDRRFFQHHGVDERGIIRAFIGNLAEPGRPQGGSTITQQVVKNLLVGEDVTYERKIREMIVASRLENTLSKHGNPRALSQLRLSRPRLVGRRDGGAQLFRQIGEGPHARRGRDAGRACSRDRASSIPTAIPIAPRSVSPMCSAACRRTASSPPRRRRQALAAPPKLVAFERPHRDSGFHFVDYLGREAKADGVESLTAEPYTVHSTINAALQRDTEAALQEGLAHYEIATGRMQFHGPEANIADAVQKLAADKQTRAPARRRCRPGSRRCRPSTCRSTTCIGSRPSWCRRAASAATMRSTSASPTAASCR